MSKRGRRISAEEREVGRLKRGETLAALGLEPVSQLQRLPRVLECLYGRPARRARCLPSSSSPSSRPSSSAASAFPRCGRRLPAEMSSSMHMKLASRSSRLVSPPTALLLEAPCRPPYALSLCVLCARFRHTLPRVRPPCVHGQAHHAQAQGQPPPCEVVPRREHPHTFVLWFRSSRTTRRGETA